MVVLFAGTFSNISETERGAWDELSKVRICLWKVVWRIIEPILMQLGCSSQEENSFKFEKAIPMGYSYD